MNQRQPAAPINPVRQPPAVGCGRGLLIGFLVAVAVAPAAGALDLSSYRWQHRLLVLAAPSAEDTALARQRESLARRADAVDDRDLVVIELYARGGGRLGERALSEAEAAGLRERLRLATGDRALLLIGKDGGVKRRAPLDTELRGVFEQIDAMPMRRDEMRERRAAGQPVTPP